MKPLILCHLGVGSTPLPMINKERVAALANLAIKAVDVGYQVLHGNVDRPAVKAVEATVNVLEESGITNSGVGAVKQSDGIQRCDASIMDGLKFSCGAVSSLERVKYPISVARRLMEFSEMGETSDGDTGDFRWNFYFCGYHVAKLFEIHGETIPQEWMLDGQPSMVPSKLGNTLETSGDTPAGDTVGAVAIDMNGNLAAGTSTGGTRGSFPGRIGDSPIIGAGTFANRFGAVSNTGRGENVIKIGAAKRVCDLIKEQDMNAMLAVDRMIREYKETYPNTKAKLGTIAIDHHGNWTVNFTGTTMTWAMKDDDRGYFGQVPGEKKEF